MNFKYYLNEDSEEDNNLNWSCMCYKVVLRKHVFRFVVLPVVFVSN